MVEFNRNRLYRLYLELFTRAEEWEGDLKIAPLRCKVASLDHKKVTKACRSVGKRFTEEIFSGQIQLLPP